MQVHSAGQSPKPSHYPPSHGSFIDRRLSSWRRSGDFRARAARGRGGAGGEGGGLRKDQSSSQLAHTEVTAQLCVEDSSASFCCCVSLKRTWWLARRSQFTITTRPNILTGPLFPEQVNPFVIKEWPSRPNTESQQCQLADDLWSTVSHRFSPNPRGQPALDHCDNLMLL